MSADFVGTQHTEVAIVGTGIAGIATAYYLCARYGKTSVILIDSRQPMSYTSAQSGDNYRNWWPHPTMVDFTDRSIDLMEAVALETSNVFNMSRAGYVLATRRESIDALVADLHAAYGNRAQDLIRSHDERSSAAYAESTRHDWASVPDGVDVLGDASLIQKAFPVLANDIRHVIHIRRAGEIDSQQLAMYMLERIREAGGKRVNGNLKGVTSGVCFELEVETSGGIDKVRAETFVNAAGPFARRIAAMLGVDLPIRNIFQQKIAFEDHLGAVPRGLPFVIDLDTAELQWADDIRDMLAEDPDTKWLTEKLPGGRHCRPDGGARGQWVKLGWAYNANHSEPQQDLVSEPRLDGYFPEIVIRGASMMLPSLAPYIDTPPARFSHYGGYYSMTAENWPLIGPMGVDGAFTVSALSGFGSMVAAAAGADCSAWICDGELPHYSEDLSLRRYANEDFVRELRADAHKGWL